MLKKSCTHKYYIQKVIIIKHSLLFKYKKVVLLLFLYFSFSSIDGTNSDRLGNMINDSKEAANCEVSIVIIHKVPHLCVFAIEDMECGEELRYDYADTPSNLWWRQNVSHNQF